MKKQPTGIPKHPVLRYLLCACFFLSVFPAFLFSQSDIKIENLALEDGLSHRLVLDILQDRNGFLWLATYYGLNRYDGTEITVFKNDPLNPSAFRTSDRFTCVEEDKDGKLWAGTLNGELIVFDPGTHTHQRFTHQTAGPAPLRSRCIKDIYISPGNTVWVTGSDEQDVDPAVQRLERYLGKGQFELVVPAVRLNQRVLHIEADEKENLWVLTEDGYYYLETGTGELLPRKVNMGGPLSIIGPQHRIWFPGTNAGQLQFADLPKNIPLKDWIHFVVDNHGNIWLKSRDGRVFKCGAANGKVEEYGRFPMYPDHIFKIHETAEGIVWATESKGGVNKIRKNKALFDVFLQAPTGFDGTKKDDISFSSMVELEDGTIISNNTKGVLFQIDPLTKKTEKAVFIAPKPKGDFSKKQDNLPSGFSGSAPKVNGIVKGGDSLTWMATSNMGLVQYDPKTAHFRSFQNDGVPLNLKVIVADGQGNIWGNGRAGIFIFDVQKEQFRWYGGESTKLTHPYFQKDKNLLWTAREGGIASIDLHGRSENHIEFFSKEKVAKRAVNCITVHRGFIWAGTFNGLVKLNPADHRFTLFTVADGLPNNNVNTIVPDGDRLWLGTYDGLSKFDIPANGFKNFSIEDGLPHPQFNIGSGTKTQQGQVLLGCKNGIIAFRPKDLKQQPISRPKLAWTEWSKYDGAKDTIVEYPMPQLDSQKTVVLNYSDKSATFRFALLPLHNPSKNKYAYLLQGYETDWNYVGNVPFITYLYIPPGQYVLKAKAADAFGNWIAEPLSIPVRVKQAWYKQWWSIGAYFVLAISGAWLAWRFQLNRKLDKQEARRLKELDTLKTRLYTNITHEFRTPLTVILGMAKQIKGNSEKVEMINRNGQNLLGLVNQMLDLSKLESGKMTLNVQRGDVVSYLKYLSESFHSYAGAKNIKLHFQSGLNALEMDFDKNKLKNIVVNLLSNAVKFTNENGDIYCDLQKENDQLILKIKDTGIGISSEKLPHIFDRFYQADDSHTRKGEGTGIGLALVKELVKLMEGEISVKSELGVGTEFLVRLPILRSDDLKVMGDEFLPNSEKHQLPKIENNVVIKNTLNAEQSLDSSLITHHSSLPILLLIEDNLDVAKYIQSCLKKDYQIQYAENGKIGIEKAIEGIPDIIISDVMMPEKDGFEVVDTLKNDERTSHIPIVLLTAKADVTSKIEGLERGADAYLAKPFNQQELRVRLGKLIELRKTLQERYSVHGQQTAVRPPSTVHRPPSIEDLFLQKVKEVILEHLDKTGFGVPQLCRQLGMSQSQLYRKLKALTNKSIAAYIRQVRLHEGKKMLQSTDHSISEVAYQTGFSSLQYFSDAFFEEFGHRPSELPK